MLRNNGLRLALYSTTWLILGWFCLRQSIVSQLDALLTGIGLLLTHGAAVGLIGTVPIRWRHVARLVYAAVSVLPAAALLLYCRFMQSDGAMNGDVIRAIAQSNPGEIIAYLARLISWPDLAVAVAVAAVFIGLFPHHRGGSQAVRASLLALAVGTIAIYQGTTPLREILGFHLAQYHHEMVAFRSMLENRRVAPIEHADSSLSGTVVVVIGESTSRRHMSRYGYVRPTTPKLDAMGNRVIAFTDVISAHSHTVPALMAALTSAGSTKDAEYFSPTSIDIVSLARAAGFEVHWLSNQNEYGLWDSPVSMLAEQANTSHFITTTVGTSFRRTAFDHKLTAELRSVLAKSSATRKLVFMHLFAAHWPYCSNHPKEMRHFTGPLGPKFLGSVPEPIDINCYDDSIRYIDSILEQSAKILEARPEAAALLYFSDHGEAPLLGTGHESFKHSSYHIDVPLLLWTNERYAALRHEQIKVARSNAARPYSTARLYHSLAQLLEIEHASVDPKSSLFSGALRDQPRYALDGKIHYDEWVSNNHYLENAAVNLRIAAARHDAIWAHRVNSIGALNEALPIFRGIEFDLVFIDPSTCFHVFHPPAEDRSLTLAEMLQAAASKPDLRMWFDWKNASAQNMASAVRCLDELDRKFDIRRRVLVETGSEDVFPGTRALSDAGYLHSYYLPTREIMTCQRNCDEAGRRQLAARLRSVVEEGGYRAISFDWGTQGFVDAYLAKWARERGLQFFSWDISIDIAGNVNAPSRIEERLSRMDLSALLVTFPSQFRN